LLSVGRSAARGRRNVDRRRFETLSGYGSLGRGLHRTDLLRPL